MVGLDNWFDAAEKSGVNYDDAKIQTVIVQGIRKFERETQFRINQIQVVANPDGVYAMPGATDGSPSLLDPGTPLYLEDGYPYFMEDAEEFFTTILHQKPVQYIQRVRLMFNNGQDYNSSNGGVLIYQLPTSWYFLDRHSSKFSLIPLSSAATITGNTVAFSLMNLTFANKGYVPGLLHFDYIAGLPWGWQNISEYSDIFRCLTEYIAYLVLCDIDETFDAGILGKSLAADSARQDIQYERFQRKKKELETSIVMFKDTLMSQEENFMMGVV